MLGLAVIIVRFGEHKEKNFTAHENYRNQENSPLYRGDYP